MACTTREVAMPDIAGPSEFAASISLTATPDSIISNGFQQSQVVVTVRDANGMPKKDVPLWLFVLPATGSLSNPSPFTDSHGQARSTYTPPVASPFTYGSPPTTVVVTATIVGSNAQTVVPSTVSIQVLAPPAPTRAP
ncbi:MAG: hypothetical protein LBQ09_04105 [Acidobacteriaceae bacterium]|nr:hypothetical protein [Acidobacteriaceae bacterium]